MPEEQLVTFSLGAEEFGVDIMQVQEIIRIPPITRVPNTMPYLEGVINLRGNIIPVLSLRIRFGMPHVEKSDLNRIIVFQVQNKVLGIQVDAVTEVMYMSEDSIEPPPSISTGSLESKYIRGAAKIGERLIVLLELDQIMSENVL